MSKNDKWTWFPSIVVCFAMILPSLSIDASDPLSRRERKDRIAALEETYQDFLEEVEPIMSPAELDVFLKMESDPQRDRFIEEFWRRRDTDPATAQNEYRDGYYARRQRAFDEYGGVNTDRGRILLVKGAPAETFEIEHCKYLRPIEIWGYFTGRTTELLLFFRPGGDYILWQGLRHTARPSRYGSHNFYAALEELLNPTGESVGVEWVFFDHMESGRLMPAYVLNCTNGQMILDAVTDVRARGMEVNTVFKPPAIDEEDVRRMLRTSVIADPDAPTIDASSSVAFVGSRGSRTLVQLTAELPKSMLEAFDLDGRRIFQINAVGETLKDGAMFERWEYRFDFPDAESGEMLPVVVERPLRAGPWELRMKLVDPQSGAEAIITETVDVPAPESVASTESGKPESLVEETLSVIRLIPPEGTILTGLQQFEAIPAGEGVAGVEFYLDGTKIMRKMRAPFSLELDLGPVPRPHVVRAVALNRRREPIDEDVLRINDGTDPFRVRIVSPRIGRGVTGPVRVEMQPRIPGDAELVSLELFLNDERVATLYGEPWMQTIRLPAEPQIAVLRVVATLEDPQVRPVEDVVILNGPENLERVDVRLIEVPTTVFVDGHPVRNLPQSAFEVLDSGQRVELSRFEQMSNQPLSIGIAIDGSASMKDRLDGARNAAVSFLDKVLTDRDQAFLVSFDRRVFTLADWTSDPEEIARGLASLRAEESTAMYDAVIESLYRFVGLEGQRALVLISDGADTASRFGWEPTLEYARRLGIPIYTIGLGIPVTQIDARSKLQALAVSTGGRSFFVSDVDELAGPYEQIETELRSQYLLGFYMPDTIEEGSEWREITVRVEGAGEIRALPGYYP